MSVFLRTYVRYHRHLRSAWNVDSGRGALAFTKTFVDDAQKKAQWTGFLKRSGVADPTLTLLAVVADIRVFLNAPLDALRAGRPFTATWSAGAWRG